MNCFKFFIPLDFITTPLNYQRSPISNKLFCNWIMVKLFSPTNAILHIALLTRLQMHCSIYFPTILSIKKYASCITTKFFHSVWSWAHMRCSRIPAELVTGSKMEKCIIIIAIVSHPWWSIWLFHGYWLCVMLHQSLVIVYTIKRHD